MMATKQGALNCSLEEPDLKLFQCEDGSCIANKLKCNGIMDCKDGEDESFKICGKLELNDSLIRWPNDDANC